MQTKIPESDQSGQQAANVLSDPPAITLKGKDNSGQPRQMFADKIAAMTDAELVTAAEQKIWLSTYANHNPRSDYHWHADAFYDEAKRRNKPELYTRAYDRAYRAARG